MRRIPTFVVVLALAGIPSVVAGQGTAPGPDAPSVAPAACDTCGTVTDHAYVSNSATDDEATATVRRLVRRLAEMGVVVGHLSGAPDAGARAVVVELADGWRGIALRPGLSSVDVVSTLKAAGAALFSEDGWVTAPTGGRSVTLG